MGSILSGLGVVVLISWGLDLRWGQSLISDWPTMKFNTALCFVLLGIGLAGIGRTKSVQSERVLVGSCGVCVVMLAGATVTETVFSLDFGIDQAVVLDPRTAPHLHPGRMSLGTSVLFVLLGTALLVSVGRRAVTAQVLSAGAFLLAAGPSLGFSYLSRWAHSTWFYDTIALHTTLGFLLGSTALLTAQPGAGLALLWSDGTAGALLLRRLGAPLLLGTWLIGLIAMLLEQVGVLTDALLTLQQLGHLILGTTLVGLTTRSLNRAESRLRQSELTNRALVESALDGVLLTTFDGSIHAVNSAVLELTGLGREELLGRAARELFIAEEREQYDSQIRACQKQSAEPRRQVRPIGLRLSESCGSLPVELRLAQVRGSQDLVHTLRDVSYLQKLEEQARHAQKMMALGTLAGGVAHDYNNIAHIIQARCSFLEDYVPEKHPGHEDLIEIRVAASRGADLARLLLASGGRQILNPRPESITRIVREISQVLASELGPSVELRLRLEPDLWLAELDRGHFDQIIFNLATNARQAMPAGGKLMLQTSNETVVGDSQEGSVLAPGEHVLLAVTDTGVGMSAEVRERAFEPFFTTKPRGHGTGLGLAMCHGIVKQLGGGIFIYSLPGAGTTLKVYLPRYYSGLSSNRASSPPPQEPGPSDGVVLVVDDDPVVCATTVRILERAGFPVHGAVGPKAAEECFSELGRVRLIVCDVLMPGMNGPEFIEKLTQSKSKLRVLYMSGFTENLIVDDGILNEGVAFLAKPFSAGELLLAVRAALSSESADAEDGATPQEYAADGA